MLLSFFGALLLFAVQPMLAKWLLPVVGGSPATWAACMVLYQALLLSGYVYAHLLTSRLAPKHQSRVHLALIALGGGALLWAPRAATPVLAPIAPALSIPWLLLQTIGVPFFLLSTTAPLVQRWTARSTHGTVHSLYAVSNAGSLIGLLAYPLLVEPRYDLGSQRTAWTALFSLYALGFAAFTLRSARAAATSPSEPDRIPIRWSARVRWTAAAFVPSAMLLAATSHITVDVAAVPLLWVIPLALYLASFVLAFGAWSPAWRAPMLLVWMAAAIGMGANAFAQAAAPLWQQLGATLLGLFASASLLHGELALDRPSASHLPEYYVCVALGGVLGGGFVSFFAPFVFSDYYELELTGIATSLFLVLLMRGRSRPARLSAFAAAGVSVPLLAAGLWLRSQSRTHGARIVERSRSFLGPLRVLDVEVGRLLTHGEIQHGFQLRDPALRDVPTLYFAKSTLAGRVLSAQASDPPRRIGAIGLGTGTIAAYGRPGDAFRFYELDAHVAEVARRDFSFLRDSKARVDVVIGDGRLSLEREPPAIFDIIVLDAFSSDAVPVHLLTREAFAVYAKHLVPNGVLLVHISNRYLSLDRVVEAGAHGLGLECALLESPSDPARHAAHALWALVGTRKRVGELVRGVELTAPAGPDVPWTDTRASLLPIVRWQRR